MILRSLEDLELKLISPCRGINSAIHRVEEEINEPHHRFFRFVEEILVNFSNLEKRIIHEIEKRKESFAEEPCAVNDDEKRIPPAHFWFETGRGEREGNLAIVEIRAEIKKRIGQIEKRIDQKFNKVAKAIQETGKKSQKHGEEEDKLRKNVQKRFHKHEGFLRTKLLKL